MTLSFVRQVEDYLDSNRTLPIPLSYPATPGDLHYLMLALEMDSKSIELAFAAALKDRELVFRKNNDAADRRTLLCAVSIASAAFYFGLTGGLRCGLSGATDKICATLEAFFSDLSTCVLLTGYGKAARKQRDAQERSAALSAPPAAGVSGLKKSG